MMKRKYAKQIEVDQILEVPQTQNNPIGATTAKQDTRHAKDLVPNRTAERSLQDEKGHITDQTSVANLTKWLDSKVG